MNLVCDYVKHNRGRKKKVRPDDRGDGEETGRRRQEDGEGNVREDLVIAGVDATTQDTQRERFNESFVVTRYVPLPSEAQQYSLNLEVSAAERTYPTSHRCHHRPTSMT